MTEIIRVSNFLRCVLFVDAVTCIGCALLLLIGGGFLQEMTNLPDNLIFYAGLFFIPFIGLLLYTATRKSAAKTIVWVIIGLNLLWVIDSFLLLVSGYVSPTTFGYVFVVFQAAGVFILADLEFIGLRKSEIIILKDSQQTL